MTRWITLPSLILGISCLATPGGLSAADTKSPSKETTGTDWSKFVKVADIIGQVAKADDNGLTLRVFTPATGQGMGGQGGGGRGGMGGGGRGGMGGGRGGMGGGMGPGMGRGGVMPHQDHELSFAEGTLIRRATLPPKLDDKGKKVAYTSKELSDLRKPAGTPGYAAEKSDLQVGMYVEVVVFRPKEIPAAKAQTSDLRVKRVVIAREGTLAGPPGGGLAGPGPKKN